MSATIMMKVQHKFIALYRLACLLLVIASPISVAWAESPAQPRSGFDRATTTQKVVALTFDADMTVKMRGELKSGKVASWYNANVIAVLERENVPATLFLTGLWIEAYPAVTKELSQNALFELGNHSYSHGGFRSPCYGLPAVKKSNEAAEVQKTDDLLRKYAVAYKKYFRFPGLCFDADDVKRVEAQDYTVVDGDVDGGDGFVMKPGPIVATVVSRVRPGSIVILHMHGGPNAPETALALPEIIKRLRAAGYSFVKVSDLLKLR
ncbi:MAG TPA: polysaccharide deacetylase family protein [Xanthobacteraceae bacterium]|nr:polysaccharide deacetylase family protein [Xanthobacteraceae bacterium]